MRLAFASQRQRRTAKAKSELNEPLGSNPFGFYMTKAVPKDGFFLMVGAQGFEPWTH